LLKVELTAFSRLYKLWKYQCRPIYRYSLTK